MTMTMTMTMTKTMMMTMMIAAGCLWMRSQAMSQCIDFGTYAPPALE